MQIQVIGTPKLENKGKYSILTVNYKNGSKTDAKNVMSFGDQQQCFNVLKEAKEGDYFEVESKKNDKGYWNWVSAKATQPSAENSSSQGRNGNYPAGGRDFETASERMKKQVYIVRQSSVANAIEYLNKVKTKYDTNEIITVAKAFESYVFGGTQVPNGNGATAEGVREVEGDGIDV